MSDALAAAVARELADWDEPVVERAMLGTEAPADVAAAFDAFCRAELGAAIVGAPFYRTSAGCVAGVELSDGRRVVVKAHLAARSDRIARCLEVRRHLVAAGFPCPVPLAGPAPLGRAVGTAEEMLLEGESGDAHQPPIRQAIARSLHRLMHLTAPLASTSGLGRAWYSALPGDQLWPRPHSPLFDFEATAHGAAWIDALAARARQVEVAGSLTVGHFDWRVEHLRFADGRVVASFDWDSLHADRETVAVGAAAHAFTTDWSDDAEGRVPSADEIRAFVADYEACRGAPFTAAERATVMASCVYSLAYSARCNHALHPDEHGFDGDFRPLLREHGASLLKREC